MPRLSGLQLQDPAASQLTSKDRLDVACALARMLVEVQGLTWEYAGKYDLETNTVKPFETHYREWIVENIQEKAAAAQSYNDHTTPSDVAWIETVIARAKPVQHLAYQPCIVLGDYGEHNALFINTEGRWQVSAIFDLMTAHFGDGQADLSYNQPKGNHNHEKHNSVPGASVQYLPDGMDRRVRACFNACPV